MKLLLYAVPYKKNVSSGPMVRITLLSNVIEGRKLGIALIGTPLRKFIKALSVNNAKVLYVESSTNRAKFLDLLNLIILSKKSEITVVYIRDVYMELFPENYKTLRKKIGKFLNNITKKVYSYISDVFAFPTLEMGEIFYDKNNIKPKKTIVLPPACEENYERANIIIARKRLEDIKIIYFGGIKYKYAGIENFFNFIKVSQSFSEFKYYLAVNDSEIYNYIDDLPECCKNRLNTINLNRNGLKKFVKKENITYFFHPRPINEYDRITYPIKIFDAISWNLPILTERHLPLEKILGEDYPLYINVNTPTEIIKKIKSITETEYFNILLKLEKIASSNSYSNRIDRLLKELI